MTIVRGRCYRNAFQFIFLALLIPISPGMTLAENGILGFPDSPPPPESGSCDSLSPPSCFPNSPRNPQLLFAFQNISPPTVVRSGNFISCELEYDKEIKAEFEGKPFGRAALQFRSEFICVDTPGTTGAEWILQRYDASLQRAGEFAKVLNPGGEVEIVHEHENVLESASYNYKVLATLESSILGERISASHSSAFMQSYRLSEKAQKGRCEETDTESRDTVRDRLSETPRTFQSHLQSRREDCNRQMISAFSKHELASYDERQTPQLKTHQVNLSENRGGAGYSYFRSLTYGSDGMSFSHLMRERQGNLPAPIMVLSWDLIGTLRIVQLGDPLITPLSQTDKQRVLSALTEDFELEESFGLEFGPSVRVVHDALLSR